MSYEIRAEFGRVLRNLEELADGPDFETVMRLDAVLISHFEKTQRDVHIDTGSLQNSAYPDTEVDVDTWVGRFEYGGPSTPKFVDYADIEKGRGGDHDFMRSVRGPEADVDYLRVLHNYFDEH